MTFEEFIGEWNNSNNYIAVKTSGSTGKPKEIRLEKDFVKESGERTNIFFGITGTSRLHSCVSPDYIGGKMMAVRAAIAGAKLTWEHPSNQPLKDISKSEGIDLLAVVPSQMLYILEKEVNLPSIKNIIVGGSPIHPNLKRRIALSKLSVYETYGMTETASHIALRKIGENDIPFKVLPEIKIETNDEECLRIIFPKDIVIQTNDIAEIVSENEFYVKGRKDHILISGGKKINPLELESKLAPLITSEFYIKGVPDEKWGQKLVLIIEGSATERVEQDLKEKMERVLERWQLPKSIIFVPHLPRTDNGKIIR